MKRCNATFPPFFFSHLKSKGNECEYILVNSYDEPFMPLIIIFPFPLYDFARAPLFAIHSRFSAVWAEKGGSLIFLMEAFQRGYETKKSSLAMNVCRGSRADYGKTVKYVSEGWSMLSYLHLYVYGLYLVHSLLSMYKYTFTGINSFRMLHKTQGSRMSGIGFIPLGVSRLKTPA